MMTEKIKLLLVDDHLMFLEGLQSLFNSDESIKVVGVATSAENALEFLAKQETDIVISDLSMPGMGGSNFVENIKKLYPSIGTLVLTMHNETEIIRQLIQQDVNGYLLKNAEKSELLRAVKTIAQDENYFSKEVQDIYIQSSFSRTTHKAYVPELSLREIEVLQLIVDEYTTKEIAKELCISQYTVESHRKNIISKLNVKNVAGLVKYAIENKLV